MASGRLPQTEINLRVSARSLSGGWLEGDAEGGQYVWTFRWHFLSGGQLEIHPSLGRALIKEPLQRFLEKNDFRLETGETYAFTVKARI
ncbi:DUF3146 family protein [Gloeobacter violaceus]|uniref:Gsr0107 protein n=1 Tax=Gloeobacter violaceus (strain ATCC 29082 / PCC 7421) TaxID=251221 RepID=Q7NPE8_GLOVI|nr:DUF3146 family protein [Gloeobacter violaceus]BAC88048.1 gsr0107 [Gloeobacter violaceus PCC 7421]